MSSAYRFEGAFRVLHVIPRGAPSPAGGARTSFLTLEFELGGHIAANAHEHTRLLTDLGFGEGRPGTLDIAEQSRRSDRLREEVDRLFDVYEVRRSRGAGRSRGIPRAESSEEALGPEAPAPSTTWVGLALVDQNGTPVPNRPYRVIQPDGTTVDGSLDSHGIAILQGLTPGSCQIWCPYVDSRPETTYTVRPGDHLSGVAERFGFDDYTTVWNAPKNADLRQQRTDPHVLQPGDRVSVPEIEALPGASKPTGAKHQFQIKRTPLSLRLTLVGLDAKPVTNTQVSVAGVSLTTDGNGLVETSVDKSATATTLDDTQGSKLPLSVGSLNPPDDASEAGYKARLYNMGFLWDLTADDDDDEMVIAVQDFQAQYAMTVTGQLDDATKAQLLQSHGS